MPVIRKMGKCGLKLQKRGPDALFSLQKKMKLDAWGIVLTTVTNLGLNLPIIKFTAILFPGFNKAQK